MTETAGKHAAKHAQSNSKEISPYDLTVKFAPELRGNLQDVIEEVRYSPAFDGSSSLIDDLKGFAEGTDVRMVVRLMKDITEGIAAHTEATKDTKAKDAWEAFSMQLIDPPRGQSPFTLIQEEKSQSR